MAPQFPIHAAKPLSEAAATVFKPIPKGSVVTAEGSKGDIKYSVTGESTPGKCPPERVIFEIGSISKVFTGLLLAQAVTEGRLKLETTVGELLGKELKFADPRVPAITLRQLATHTSGLPRLPDNLSDGINSEDPYAAYDRGKLVAFLVNAHLTGEAPFEPDYSNLGMGLLGDLLSKVYGKSWEDLVAEKIAGPLGMKDTVVHLSDGQKVRFVTPYAGKKKEVPWTFDALAGCGALRSTAADLVLFGKALLHPESTPFKGAIELMEQPQTKEGDFGLALMLTQPGGESAFEHNGGTAGFRSMLQVAPDKDTIRVLLSNNGNAPLEKMLAEARGEKPRTRESGKILTPEQLSAYPGIYKINEHARFTVLIRGGELWTQLTGQAFLRLFPHEDTDRFFLKVVVAELQFTRDEKGVTGLTLYQNGHLTKAVKTADPAPTIKFRSPRELETYAGIYELTPVVKFTLKVQGNTLFAQLSGQPFVPVFEKRDDWFEYDVVEAALAFERDTSGKIVAVNLHQNGIVQRAVKK
jgi:CubicO group peptidase (beta-lactamase class C family)